MFVHTPPPTSEKEMEWTSTPSEGPAVRVIWSTACVAGAVTVAGPGVFAPRVTASVPTGTVWTPPMTGTPAGLIDAEVVSPVAIMCEVW